MTNPIKNCRIYEGHGGVSIFDMEEFWSAMESVKNPNKKGVSENIAISWISCILIARKQTYYAIKWAYLKKTSKE